MVGDVEPFREQVEAFVTDRYALDPTAATIAGIHEHDHRLADLSEDGFAARDAFADRWLHVFESHDAPALSPTDRPDPALILRALRGERAPRPFPPCRPPPSPYSHPLTPP